MDVQFFFSFSPSGSGKSYLAKMLRDVDVENGAAAPRVHSMDDYFMTEVEKVLLLSFLLICHSIPHVVFFFVSTLHVYEIIMLVQNI